MSSLTGVAQVQAGITALADAPLGGEIDDLDLHASVTTLHRLEQQLAAEKLRRIAELDHRKAHTGHARDTASWLTTTMTVSRPEALGLVRTATALSRLPVTAAALRAGDASVAQAGVAAGALAELDRCADADLALPADATSRLDAHVADRAGVCDRAVLRRELDALLHDLSADALEDKEAIAYVRRDARFRKHDDGTQTLSVRMDPIAAAKARAVLTPLARKDAADDLRSYGQRLADAFHEVLDRALQTDLPEVAARRPHAILVTSPQALHDEPGAEPSWLDGHGPVSSATAAQICCDADVTIVIRTADGTVLDAKPWRASPTKAQRAAVLGRDRRCVGCGAPASRCEIHHITWRRNGGKTVIANLVLVCWECHHSIHHHRWWVDTDETGAFVLRPPTYTRHSP